MLGWEVYVYREGRAEPENALVHWKSGSSVVDWMEELARNGLARDCGGTGYPWIFTVKAEVLKSALRIDGANQREPKEPSKSLIPPVGLRNYDLLKAKVLKKCAEEEVLLVYAWDKS